MSLLNFAVIINREVHVRDKLIDYLVKKTVSIFVDNLHNIDEGMCEDELLHFMKRRNTVQR